MELIGLKDTTVEIVNGVKIGCSNFYVDTYSLPDGRIVTGLTAQLLFFDTDNEITVGSGSEFYIKDTKFKVIKFEKDRFNQVFIQECQ